MNTILVANGDSSKTPRSFSQGVQLATAKANPEALAAQIEELNPDLLVISFTFDALPLTRFLSSKFTSLKIFLSEAPSFKDLIEGLKAGACGSALKGATEEELKLAVSATLKECLLIGPSGEAKFIVYPQPHKIKRFECWLDWLAQNILDSWRSSPCLSSTEAFFDTVGVGERLDLMDSLGKGVKLSFREELKRIFDNFDASPSEFIDTLEKAETILNSWLYNVASEESCLTRIKNNALLCQRQVKIRSREFLKTLDGGTLACCNWLEQAQRELKKIAQNVEQTKVRESEKEKSATRAYRHLYEQLKVSDSKLDFESAKRALLISYQSILSKNINGVGLVIIDQLSQELESYRQVVFQSDHLLNEGKLSRDFGLKDQLRRASVSIPTNISEGFERASRKEYLNFLNIAKGSAGEVRSLLRVALEVGYLEPSIYSQLHKQTTELFRMLSSQIQSIHCASST